MLLNRTVLNSLLKKQLPVNLSPVAYSSTFNEKYVIGKREWVGYGINSTPNYEDRPDFPLPAVRIKEITGPLIALKEKEKGDWKKLTIEEKKLLYRASFRQTFAEVDAPTGEWKSVMGWTVFFTAVGLWIYILEKWFLYKPLPSTFSEEHRRKQLRAMLDLKMGALTGVSSKWDYEKDTWK